MRKYLPIIIILCTQIVGGCRAESDRQIGPRLDYTSDLFPSNLKSGPVLLRLADVEVPANATIQSRGSERTLFIARERGPLDKEVYLVDTKGISLRELNNGDTFRPPLTLLRFPMQIGDKVVWRGSFQTGDAIFRAHAETATEKTLLQLASGPVETVHARVALTLMPDSERRLDVWFAKGKGPVKRDFGNQVREPR